MKVIIGPKGSGKTTKLIKICAKEGGYIVCQHQQEAHRIFQIARDMGCVIPLPITYDEFLRREYYGPGVRTIYVDNVDMLIQTMASMGGVRVNAITLTKSNDTKEGK